MSEDNTPPSTQTVTESMLTTVDNPWDPFTQFRPWYAFDTAAGYHSTDLLARITITSPELSEEDQRLDNEAAIDEIVRENVSGVHRKVTREVPADRTMVP